MPVNTIIEQCEHIHRDISLDSVKTWKDKTKGKAIGYLPVYVPRELIHAAGMLPVDTRSILLF